MYRIGDSVKVDRKASTPSSSSSDISKNQTFLDKNVKTFLAVITQYMEMLFLMFYVFLPLFLHSHLSPSYVSFKNSSLSSSSFALIVDKKFDDASHISMSIIQIKIEKFLNPNRTTQFNFNWINS